MTIPTTQYVVDAQGQKVFVQLSVQDWETFVREFQRVEQQLLFKGKLKEALQEVRQIQRGEKKGQLLNDLLNEL